MEGFKETLLTPNQPFPVDAFLMQDHSASYTYAAHHHTYIELMYVLEGGILLETPSLRTKARTGDLVVFQSGAVHAVAGTEGPHSKILVVQFLPEILTGTSGQDPAQRHLQSFLHPAAVHPGAGSWPGIHKNLQERRSEWHDLAMSLYGEFSARQPGYELSVRSCLYRMIVFLLREGLLEAPDSLPHSADLQRLSPLLEWLNVHYRENIHLNEAAQLMNFSYAYMSRLFKRVTGRSFRAYVEHVRVCEAEACIRHHGFTITQAALECGFGSASAFSRAYRRMRGHAPRTLSRP